jgi:DNA-binding response OmpR family regulator
VQVSLQPTTTPPRSTGVPCRRAHPSSLDRYYRRVFAIAISCSALEAPLARSASRRSRIAAKPSLGSPPSVTSFLTSTLQRPFSLDRPLFDDLNRPWLALIFRSIDEALRMRLLIVEDNAELAELLAKGLLAAGYETDILSTVEEATSVLLTTFYAALILDLGLPDGDGLALLREIWHRNNPIPVLVLTARGGLHDRVHGLRSGADDYLVKPFALEELIARLEAQLRRPGHLLGSSLRIANLEFDTRNRQASIDDRPQLLSARETEVLELLMRSKGRVVSKKQVEDHIFGHSGDVASNAIEVYVHRLRKQLSERGAKVQVHTIRGVGYLIAEEN